MSPRLKKRDTSFRASKENTVLYSIPEVGPEKNLYGENLISGKFNIILSYLEKCGIYSAVVSGEMVQTAEDTEEGEARLLGHSEIETKKHICRRHPQLPVSEENAVGRVFRSRIALRRRRPAVQKHVVFEPRHSASQTDDVKRGHDGHNATHERCKGVGDGIYGKGNCCHNSGRRNRKGSPGFERQL